MSNFFTDLQERLKRKQKEEESIKAAELLAAQEKEEKEMAKEQSEEPIVETSDEVIEEIVDETVEDETVKDDETESEETIRVVEKEVPVEVVIQVETIPMELFRRILEYVHSNIRTLEGIKQITSKVQGLIEDHGVLSLDDYEDILNSIQEPEESTEKLYREGATATNPSTGEKLVFRSGKWRPCDDCQQ